MTACDPTSSCDFSACYDDVEFTKEIIYDVASLYCIDLDSVHLTGASNGGMYSYFAGWYIITYYQTKSSIIICAYAKGKYFAKMEVYCILLAPFLNSMIASIAPVCGTPFLGFDLIPETPMSLIDFHGIADDTIPFDLNRYARLRSESILQTIPG